MARRVRCTVIARMNGDGNNNEKYTPNSSYFLNNLYCIKTLGTSIFYS